MMRALPYLLAAVTMGVLAVAVVLVAASGIRVPDVRGLSVDEARSEIRSAGFLTSTRSIDATAAEQLDTVMALDPVAGSSLPEGERVVLFVGRRPRPDEVDRPDEFPDDFASVVFPRGEVGTCSVAALSGDQLLFRRIDCAEPHDLQLMGDVQVEVGGYNVDALDTALEELCAQMFDEFVGADYFTSSLFVYWDFPDAGSWSLGDRTGHCYLLPGSLDRQLVGDAYGKLW